MGEVKEMLPEIKEKNMPGKFSLLTLASVYFLILVGGIVRSTGAGMGCPDWPRCFGQWVPPTHVAELPADYKKIYSEKRAEKNQKLAKYFLLLGFDDLANDIVNDPSILEEADFNAVKTWIEYINRLIGAIIGLLVVGTVYFSWRFVKTRPSLFYLALVSLLLVAFQGWVGSLVVSTNLIPFMVTIHMLIALVIVALLCAIVVKSNPASKIVTANASKIKVTLVVAMMLTIVQVILGTQVRESVDEIMKVTGDRSLWIDRLGTSFIIHRSFSWLILISNSYLIFLLYKNNVLTLASALLAAVIVTALASGVAMAWLGVPALLQPLHLLLGTLGFGLQFFLFLQLNSKRPSLI